MNNKVINVKPLENYHLELWFVTGEHLVFDMSPFLDKGVFTQLKDVTA